MEKSNVIYLICLKVTLIKFPINILLEVPYIWTISDVDVLIVSSEFQPEKLSQKNMCVCVCVGLLQEECEGKKCP